MERWSSRTGFLLAAVGAAVGLGNIWRFSAVVGQNGGGAYLVPYLIAAFAFAVPLLILELSVGRSLRLDVVSAFKSIDDRFAVLGWVVTGSVVLVLSYYLVLTGWVLAFLVDAVTGGGMTFAGFTGGLTPLGYFVVVTAVTAAIVSLGVRDGIERMATIVMPVILVILVGLAIYAATLPGFGEGVAFLFTPDLAKLADPLVWSAAFGQVFFSLSVGQGIMLTFGSYLDEATDIVRSSIVITVADIAVAIVAGLVIFPVVFTFGLRPTLGTELAFSTLPRAFASMPFGAVVGVLFFGLLFFAALSSAVALLEVGVAAALRTTTRDRGSVTLIVTGIVFAIGLPSALSYTGLRVSAFGVPFLDLMDETVGTLGLPVTAILIAVVFTWYQRPDALRAQLGDSVLVPVVKYVIPGVLFVVTALRLGVNVDFPGWRTLPGAAFIGSLPQSVGTLALLVLLFIAGRWLVAAYPSRIPRSPWRNRRRGGG